MTDRYTLHHGDCIEVMRTMPDNSVDAIVTDPPYELGFMGKSWDAIGIAFNVLVWTEALRILKPGGHLLAFSGSRTYHRMAVAIEDAGFEIRDQIMWIYGSGFPKPLDVSKAIDKQRDDREDVLRVTGEIARLREAAGLTNRDLDGAFGFAGMAGHWTSTKSQPTVPTVDQWTVLRDMLNAPEWLDAEVWRLNGRKGTPGEAWEQREATGQYENAAPGQIWNANYDLPADLTAKERRDNPATPAAQQWQGWGTALKPAHEPIVLARKPLIGTVAANVLTHGTGALNINGTRVGAEGGGTNCTNRDADGNCMGHGNAGRSTSGETVHGPDASGGRWPANVIHDGSDEVVALFPTSKSQSGTFTITKKEGGWDRADKGMFDAGRSSTFEGYGDSGSAARFFYCAKASRRDRNEGLDAFDDRHARTTYDKRVHDAIGGDTGHARKNHHPTVKPTDLMRYLIRLITPPQGVVLDPFMGSGSTGKAAMYEGNRFIGIEQDADYLAIAEARIKFAQNAEADTLFGDA